MHPVDYTFVAGNRRPRLFRNDPSFVYRCENPARALAAQGHRVEQVHLKHLDAGIARKVVVFHRPRASRRLASTLRRLRRHGTVLIAEFDDLVFDEAYYRYSPAVLNRRDPRWLVRRRYRAHQAAIPWFDGVTVATQPLADHLCQRFSGMPVKVIPNCIHHAWQLENPVPRLGAEQKILTYFPGTRSHDRDFQQIQQPLARFLDENPEVCLRVTGSLDFHLAARPGQVTHVQRVPYTEYRQQVRAGWLNLAPLEATPFTRCKSALKVIEAACWGIPTISSPIPDTERLVGLGAVTADTPEAWLGQLRDMLDVTHYQSIARDLAQRIRKVADIREQVQHFASFSESLLGCP